MGIGEGRVYADIFLIVNDDDWDSIKGTENTLAILEYDKDPSAKGLSYDGKSTASSNTKLKIEELSIIECTL